MTCLTVNQVSYTKSRLAPMLRARRHPLKDDWELLEDNSFAFALLNSLAITDSRLFSTRKATLCGRCQSLDFWAIDFIIKDTLTDLETRSQSCEFCSLLNTCTVERLNEGDPNNVEFRRVRSSLFINRTPTPVLSVRRDVRKCCHSNAQSRP